LKSQKNTRKRRKAFTLILLPAVVFIWLIGWSLYWIGLKRKTTEKKSAPKEYDVTMLVIPDEQTVEARS
jgi:flagellar basal body-associated protein FliL